MSNSTAVQDALDAFSKAANKGDVGTHPFDQDRFYKAVQVAYDQGVKLEFSELDTLFQSQGWASAEARRELADRFTAAYDMLAYERTGSTFNRNG